MYFDVRGQSTFASTGGRTFDNTLPTVMFLHGSGLDHSFWELYSRFFATRKYGVVAPDFPGHTNSAGSPLTSIDAMADWLNDMVEALGAGNISIVGHSQGCLVALEYAARHKKNLKSISFIASGLATPVNAALIDAAANKPEAAIAMMLDWGFGPAGHPDQGPAPGNAMVTRGRKVMQGNVPDALASDLRACDAYENGKTAAAAIDCPVQVILAGKDRMAPHKAGMELVAHLASPELHIIEASGHMLPQESPDECLNLLRAFIFGKNPSNWIDSRNQ